MAGAKAGNFNELISPFLRKEILEAEQQFGAHSPEYRALTSQYIVKKTESIPGSAAVITKRTWS
jgi:hypothetical protein